jgi:hypothetical protein
MLLFTPCQQAAADNDRQSSLDVILLQFAFFMKLSLNVYGEEPADALVKNLCLPS